ncbi:MAG: hypothetical protein IPH86_16755 [bacterium]|nr:hypothetical protein [bacterium]
MATLSTIVIDDAGAEIPVREAQIRILVPEPDGRDLHAGTARAENPCAEPCARRTPYRHCPTMYSYWSM